MPRTSLLEGKRVIVTGCWYKPIEHIFHDFVDGKPTHDEIGISTSKFTGRIDMEDQYKEILIEMKMNIGTAIAATLARNGAEVIMVSHNEKKIREIKSALLEQLSKDIDIKDWVDFFHKSVDLLDEESVKNFVSKLPIDKPIYRVQSIWLWAGDYQLKNDNPYLPLEEIDVWLIQAETTTALKGTHLMMKEFLPIFKKQQESRIVIVSSMSAIRSYILWASHCSAKAAIDRYANTAMLELYKNKIRVSTVRPWTVDTGLYDNLETRKVLRNINKEYNGSWETDDDITLMPPSAVWQVVNTILTSPAHIAEVNMISKSQPPHQGS